MQLRIKKKNLKSIKGKDRISIAFVYGCKKSMNFDMKDIMPKK
jgi:hypothetical protein